MDIGTPDSVAGVTTICFLERFPGDWMWIMGLHLR